MPGEGEWKGRVQGPENSGYAFSAHFSLTRPGTRGGAVASTLPMVTRPWRWSAPADQAEQSPLRPSTPISAYPVKMKSRSPFAVGGRAPRPLRTTSAPVLWTTSNPLASLQGAAARWPVTEALGRKRFASSPDRLLSCATPGKWLCLPEPPRPSWVKRDSQPFCMALPRACSERTQVMDPAQCLVHAGPQHSTAPFPPPAPSSLCHRAPLASCQPSAPAPL